MRGDACDNVRLELSARLDGEVTAATERMLTGHLSGCAGCRAYEEELHRLRRAVRLQPTGPVPDMRDRIRHAVAAERAGRRRVPLMRDLRAAALAAAATIAVVFLANLPAVSPERDVATASQVVQGIRRAARSLTSYTATFEVVERNYSTDLVRRRFVADVAFSSPESLVLSVSDRSRGSAGYSPQHYGLRASPRVWSASEPSRCIPQTVYTCPSDDQRVRWGVRNRQPFDGSTRIPTDIVLPLESIASAGDLTLLGRRRILGRIAVGVETTYAAAPSLVRALDPFEVWRPVHPLDRVQVWLDASTWFPLRVRVLADDSDQRRVWAVRRGIPDDGGAVVLDVRATKLTESDPKLRLPVARTVSLNGGFTETAFRPVPKGPSFVAGLRPYRAGTTGSGDRVAAYAQGMTWLRVSTSPARPVSVGAVLRSVEMPVGAGGYIYYTPAAVGSARRVDVYGDEIDLHLESNLPREMLLEIASSVDLIGERRDVARSGAALTRRVSPSAAERRYPFARVPRHVPEGYSLAGSYVTSQARAEPLVIFVYRRPETDLDPAGVRVMQSRGFRRLPPTSEDSIAIPLGTLTARWSTERGELEWIDAGTYRSISVPSLDLEAALQIARSLR